MTAKIQFAAAFSAVREFDRWAALSPEATPEAIEEEGAIVASMPFGPDAMNVLWNRDSANLAPNAAVAVSGRTEADWNRFADDLEERLQFAANS